MIDPLATLLDHHWLHQGIETGKAYCTCGGWEFDANVGRHPLPTLGERFAPFSQHVADAIRAAGVRETRSCPDCLHPAAQHSRGGMCDNGDDPCHCVRMAPIEDAFTYGPDFLAHSFAMKHGLREGSTFPQAEALERDLRTFLRAALASPDTGDRG